MCQYANWLRCGGVHKWIDMSKTHHRVAQSSTEYYLSDKTRINTDKRRLKDCSSLSYIFSFPLRKSALILRFNKDLNSVELRVTLWWNTLKTVQWRRLWSYLFDGGSIRRWHCYRCPVLYFVFLRKEHSFPRWAALFYMYMFHCSTCTCRTVPHVHVVLLYMYI